MSSTGRSSMRIYRWSSKNGKRSSRMATSARASWSCWTRISASLPSHRRDHVSFAQHKQNGRSGSPSRSRRSSGSSSKSASGEPVEVVAETVDAVVAGEPGLIGTGLLHTQVVEAQVCRDVWDCVSRILRNRGDHVRPVGEAGSPPFVVLGDGMELREVERDDRWIAPMSPSGEGSVRMLERSMA